MDASLTSWQTSVMLKHAILAYNYPFIKRSWSDDELRNFHKPLFKGDIEGFIDTSKIQPTEPQLKQARSEDITAYLMLKQSRSLSIKEGSFMITEYIEQRPPLINNFGMCSKLRRFYKGYKADFPAYMGSLGTQEILSRDDNDRPTERKPRLNHDRQQLVQGSCVLSHC